jgi:dGTP triphosphohydrolase
MKINTIHRGLTHLLVTGAILHTAGALGRWAERNGVGDPGRFLEIAGEAVRGGEVSLPPAAERLLEGIERFLEVRVRRGYQPARVEARGHRVLLGLFAAYQADPRLLEDHVLLRYKEIAGRRYLRDLPADAVDAETSVHYRGDPRFARLLVDYLAGMTDAYAIREYGKLGEIGAVPGIEPFQEKESSP